ncbi:MAG: hypothetical protein GQ570_03930 [Helicobacteraceae bacterium]|nr:hypothetical protein [Helicobacteraceae bacterium]
MAINVSNLEIQLSGGAANSDQNASLGGIISNVRVLAQSTSGISTVTGVVIDDASGNALGDGTLSFTYNGGTGKTLSWQDFADGSAGSSIDVDVDGTYAIASSGGGYLFVTVTSASLAVADQSDTITVTNVTNGTFDDISSSESFNGDTEYRGFYIKNTHGIDTAFGVKIWIDSQPVGADSLAIGVDPAGVGDGSTGGVAVTIANEGVAPSGVTFTTPGSQGAGILIGDLLPGQCAAYWQRRVIPAETTVKTLNDVSTLGFSAFL